MQQSMDNGYGRTFSALRHQVRHALQPVSAGAQQADAASNIRQIEVP
jgi:hypothetical protein